MRVPKHHPNLLHVDHTALVVIDMQEPFLRNIFEPERLLRNVRALMQGANALRMPIIGTTQVALKMGDVIPPVKSLLPPQLPPFDKVTFDCMGAPSFVSELRRAGRKQILLCGVEFAHLHQSNGARSSGGGLSGTRRYRCDLLPHRSELAIGAGKDARRPRPDDLGGDGAVRTAQRGGHARIPHNPRPRQRGVASPISFFFCLFFADRSIVFVPSAERSPAMSFPLLPSACHSARSKPGTVRACLLAVCASAVLLLLAAGCARNPSSNPVSPVVTAPSATPQWTGLNRAGKPEGGTTSAPASPMRPEGSATTNFVGDLACSQCHTREFHAHQSSYHALTLRFADRASLGNLAPKAGALPGNAARVERDGDGYRVVRPGAQGVSVPCNTRWDQAKAA